jgi:hypothetical protein
METNIDPKQNSQNWFEIWRSAFLHPTIQTFSKIAGDPKASLGWGLIWAGLAALLFWILGPQRELWWGLVASQIGLKAGSTFLVVGTIASPILGMLALLVLAAVSHGLARLFGGLGTYRQLVFCWGVIQLPFVLFSGLMYRLYPYAISLLRLISPGAVTFAGMRIILLVVALIAAAGLLYLYYAQWIAFSAVEQFGIGKGLVVLILLAILLGAAGACLSTVIRGIVMRQFMY